MEKYPHLHDTEMYRIVHKILQHLPTKPASVSQITKKAGQHFNKVIKYLELIDLIQQADRVKIDIAPDKYLISKSIVKRP